VLFAGERADAVWNFPLRVPRLHISSLTPRVAYETYLDFQGNSRTILSAQPVLGLALEYE
jgi:hypothetical protein